MCVSLLVGGLLFCASGRFIASLWQGCCRVFCGVGAGPQLEGAEWGQDLRAPRPCQSGCNAAAPGQSVAPPPPWPRPGGAVCSGCWGPPAFSPGPGAGPAAEPPAAAPAGPGGAGAQPGGHGVPRLLPGRGARRGGAAARVPAQLLQGLPPPADQLQRGAPGGVSLPRRFLRLRQPPPRPRDPGAGLVGGVRALPGAAAGGGREPGPEQLPLPDGRLPGLVRLRGGRPPVPLPRLPGPQLPGLQGHPHGQDLHAAPGGAAVPGPHAGSGPGDQQHAQGAGAAGRGHALPRLPRRRAEEGRLRLAALPRVPDRDLLGDQGASLGARGPRRHQRRLPVQRGWGAVPPSLPELPLSARCGDAAGRRHPPARTCHLSCGQGGGLRSSPASLSCPTQPLWKRPECCGALLTLCRHAACTSERGRRSRLRGRCSSACQEEPEKRQAGFPRPPPSCAFDPPPTAAPLLPRRPSTPSLTVPAGGSARMMPGRRRGTAARRGVGVPRHQRGQPPQ